MYIFGKLRPYLPPSSGVMVLCQLADHLHVKLAYLYG